LSRIQFVGTKDYDTLQQYYATCDVNLLPFKRCQTSDYSDPLKIVEGCNHGKITVATNIPAATLLHEKYPNAILISETHDKFLRNIELAIYNSKNQNIKDESMRLANELTWDSRVDIIEAAINTHFSEVSHVK
jgi:glycosyltransferase involved in cell wall biosynthesis